MYDQLLQLGVIGEFFLICHMGRYSRLGKNTVLVFIGNTDLKLIGLLMLPFYTRCLSVEDYGITDIINVYVIFLLSVVLCCIAESKIHRFIFEYSLY